MTTKSYSVVESMIGYFIFTMVLVGALAELLFVAFITFGLWQLGVFLFKVIA